MRKLAELAKEQCAKGLDRVQRNARGGWHFWRTWIRAMYLPDEVNFYADSFIRLLFCLYYLPSIVVVLAVTHSALERVVWVLVVPITQEMERNPYHFSSLQTLSVGLSRIAIRIAPFAALGTSFATVGHKAANCFVEAMLDAYTTNNDKDYPLLHARLQFVLEKRGRVLTLLAVMVALAVAVVYVFEQHAIAHLSRDEPPVLVATAVVALIQGLYVLLTVLSGAPDDVIEVFTGRFTSVAEMLSALDSSGKRRKHAGQPGETVDGDAGRVSHAPLSPVHASGNAVSPSSTVSSEAVESVFDSSDVTPSVVRFVTYFLGDWWTHSIQYMRHIGFAMSALFGVTVAARAGLIQGATSTILLLMCLNVPHLYAYVSLMVTFAAIRTLRSFHWLLRHPDVLFPVLVVDMPYQIVLLHALYYFRNHPATCALLLAVNVLLVARAIDLVWEYDVSEHGSVHWEDATQECVGSRQSSPNVRDLSGSATTPSSPPHGDRHESASNTANDSLRRDSESLYSESGSALPTAAPRTAASGGAAGGTPSSWPLSHASRSGYATGESGLVKPTLAIILEDAYEKHHQRPGLVSLDMTIDTKHMRIRYADKKKKGVALVRHQVYPYGAGRRFLRDRNFYAYVLPRLLSLQSPGYFAGAAYRTARVILRVITITALLLFTLIVFGMIVQASFPQLRSIPVRVTSPADQSFLTIDHVVVRMNLLSAIKGVGKTSRGGEVSGGAGSNERSEAPERGSAPVAARTVFQWSNDTAAAGEDFYPRLCRRDYYGTSVWELSLLALAPYLFNLDEVGTLLDFMNEHLQSDWEIKERHGSSCVTTDSAHAPTKWSSFYDFYSAKRETSVIALRGTDLFSFADFLVDINLFFETVLYQVMTFFVPGAIMVPKELIIDLIRAVSLRDADEPEEDVGNVAGGFAEARARGTWAALVASTNSSLRRCQQNNYRRDFYVDVQNHLTYVATHPRDGRLPKHVILTGHSLGGAVAAIVAARMELEAVAFSAPGIALSRKKFNVDLRAIHKNVMTVASTNDIVPSLGEQSGELHHVECLAVRREMCHAIEFMVGSLWKGCGSVRGKFPAIADIA